MKRITRYVVIKNNIVVYTATYLNKLALCGIDPLSMGLNVHPAISGTVCMALYVMTLDTLCYLAHYGVISKAPVSKRIS